MADNPTLKREEIEKLVGLGVYTPEQGNKLIAQNGAFEAKPNAGGVGVAAPVSTEERDAKIDQWAAGGSITPEEAAARKATPAGQTFSPVASPSPAPAAQAAPAAQPTIPASIAAPGVTNTAPPAVFPTANAPSGAPVASGAPAASSIPSVSLSAANPLTGPEGKDARANEITGKYDSEIGKLQSQLDAENAKVADGTGMPNPNLVSALKVKIDGLTKAKDSALQANEAAFKAYVKDEDGNYHLDSSKLGNLTPRQAKDYQLANAVLEQKNLGQAQKKERDAVEAQVAAQTAQNDASAAAYGDMASQMKQATIDRQKREALFQTELAQRTENINKSITDFNSTNIDPNKYWQNQSTAGIIGTSILAGLVGGLNAANGIQGNQVLARIDQQIANDIDAQKANLAKKAKGIEFQNSALATFERQGYDREQAIALTQAAGYDAIKMQLQGKLATLGNAATQANGQALIAQLEQKSAQARSQALAPYVNASIAGHVVQTGTGHTGRSAIMTDKEGNRYVINYATNKPESPTQQDELNQTKIDKKGGTAASGRFQQSSAVQTPDAKTVYFPNPKIAEEKQIKLQFAQEALEKIRQLREAGTKSVVPITAGQKGHNQNISELQTGLGVAYGKFLNPKQQLSPAELERINHNLDPGMIGDANNTVPLNRMEQEIKKSIDEIVASGSTTPIAPGGSGEEGSVPADETEHQE